MAPPSTPSSSPLQVEKAAKREVEVAVAVLEVRPCAGGGQGSQAFPPAFLLMKRPEKGLLAGLWQFPLVELGAGEGAGEGQEAVDVLLAGLVPGLHAESKDRSAPVLVSRRALGDVVHVFSHIRMTIRAEHVLVAVRWRWAFERWASLHSLWVFLRWGPERSVLPGTRIWALGLTKPGFAGGDS